MRSTKRSQFNWFAPRCSSRDTNVMKISIDRTIELCEVARQAGRRIMSFYKSGSSVTFKEDASPLTAADRASHEFLMQSLQELTPAIPVISEESDQAANGASACASTFWLVDPLDGTK